MFCYEIIVKKMGFVRMNKLSFQQFCKIAFGSRKNERMQPKSEFHTTIPDKRSLHTIIARIQKISTSFNVLLSFIFNFFEQLKELAS